MDRSTDTWKKIEREREREREEEEVEEGRKGDSIG